MDLSSVKNMIALDCGNSSYRVLLGRFEDGKLTTQVIGQRPNSMVQVGDYLYWDMLKIYDGFLELLAQAIAKAGRIDSIGVATWGVDFALYDAKGYMIGNPLSYRNTIGAKHLSMLSDAQQKELFYQTGILCDKINSAYMIKGIMETRPEQFSIADKLLMVPDILNYMLTGVMQNEPSELSTTQLMDARTRKLSKAATESFGIPESLFCEIGVHGRQIGNLQKHILERLQIDYDIPVICVPSHDTACAIAAIPAQEDDFIYISSGTWSLIGTELDQPAISDAVMDSRLTNEVGAYGKITLLKNSAGMFIIQRLKKEYDQVHQCESTWDGLDELGDRYTGTLPLFDVNHPRYFNPKRMSTEIWDYLCESGQASGELDWGGVFRAVQESIACSYAVTIGQIEQVTGKTYDKIYIVGGGSKNVAVNRLTAKRTGKTVVACSKESTALGNIAVQLASFTEGMGLTDIRRIIADSTELKTYHPEQVEKDAVEKYNNLP